MEKATYSEEFKEQALCKLYHRNGRIMKAIADELNVPPRKLRSWLASARAKKMTTSSQREKLPEEWSIEARLLALQQSHGLAESELASWCARGRVFLFITSSNGARIFVTRSEHNTVLPALKYVN